MSDAVIVQREADVGVVRLNRPDKFNAISRGLADGMDEAFAEFAADDGIRAVVLTGNGPAFCAGGDLGWIWEQAEGNPRPVFYELAGRFHEAILKLRNMPKAVVAAINGPAVGGGFSLALACDLRLISKGAYLKVGYTSSGLTLDGGGSFALPRIVGQGRAMELVALDEKVSPSDAHEWGLVNRLVGESDLTEEALEMADRLAGQPCEAIARTKRLFNRSFEHSLERHLEAERRQIAESAETAEGREGIEAFLERREADFRRAGADED